MIWGKTIPKAITPVDKVNNTYTKVYATPAAQSTQHKAKMSKKPT